MHRLGNIGKKGRAPGYNHLDSGQVVVVDQRMLCQRDNDRRHHVKLPNAVILNELQKWLQIEAGMVTTQP